MAMALDGIRVLELANFWAGPSASMYLADQGADVIKIESPAGDDARRLFTHPDLGNESPSFLVVNRNKRGMVVDIRKSEGLEVVHKLLGQVDVLIHNFRPRVTKRYGLDYEDLAAINPGLVYVHLSAYGSQGPYADRPGYDLLAQALSGMMHRSMPDGTPIGAGIWAADCATPIGLAYGIAVALLVRERTGKGQKIETSLLQMAIAMQHVDLVRPAVEPPEGRAPANQATFAPYCGLDGQWFLPAAVNDKEWVKMARAVGLEELGTDPAFVTVQARSDHASELFEILSGIYATKSRDEWLRLLHEHDVPCAPILPRDDVFHHPQVLENEMIVEVEHATAGPTKMLGVPIKMSGNHTRGHRPSPLQGEHTLEVLRELGYDESTINKMRNDGVISGS